MIGLSVLASDMKPRLPDSWIQNQSFPIYLRSRGLILPRKAAISTQLGSIFRQDFRVVRTKSSGFLKHLSGQMKHIAMALVGYSTLLELEYILVSSWLAFLIVPVAK